MQNFLNKIIYIHIKDKTDFALISKVSFIYIFSTIGIIAAFFFGVYNTLIGNIGIGYAEISVSLFQILSIVFFRKYNKLVLTSNILYFLLYLLLTMLIITGGMQNTGMYWIFVFPLIIYFIKNQYSKYWILLFIATMISVAIMDNVGILNTPYTFIEYRQAFFSFITISLIVYFYNKVIILQRKQLVESKNSYKYQKELAKASEKSKLEFLANMSHEIRTPLNAILGFVELLKDESRGRKSLEYVEIIDSSSQSLLHIIEDILDFSKMESGKINIDKIDFNPKKEFEVLVHLFSAKCSEKNINLSLVLGKDLPPSVNTDPLRIKQIISNLLSNAIKFTTDGKNIILEISYKDELLSVSVKDEGKGIAKDKLEHIFESFSQEDSSTTREYGGTGLGLSISSELVKLLDGKLKVKSEVDIGSEFYFSIPAKIGNEIQEIKDEDINITFDEKKALLVEDNKANQMFMKLVLKKLNMKFDIANDGLEAIDMFKKEKYDIILMDENMPNLNGIEATKQILNIEKEDNLEHTPIIALTANALKGDKQRFLEAGMDEYMTKPVDRKLFSNLLEKLFQK